MDKMREEFEAWCHNNPLKVDKRISGEYKYISTDLAWQAWQASRAALVVELPENGEPIFSNDFSDGVVAGAGIYRSAVEYALDKQGIKWK